MSDLMLFIEWLKENMPPDVWGDMFIKANGDYEGIVERMMANPDAMPALTELVPEAVIYAW